jgi:hypothetical protein
MVPLIVTVQWHQTGLTVQFPDGIGRQSQCVSAVPAECYVLHTGVGGGGGLYGMKHHVGAMIRTHDQVSSITVQANLKHKLMKSYKT